MSTAADAGQVKARGNKHASLLLFTLQPLLGVGFQICADNTARALGATPFGIEWLLAFAQSPWAWAAVALDIAALSVWVVVLSSFSLGAAFALTSTAYVLVIACSVVLFHEPLHWSHLIGGSLILTGISLVVSGDRRDHATPDRSTS